MPTTYYSAPFPPFIDAMPKVPLAFDGLTGWRVNADGWQVIFMEAEKTITIPSHHHGPQWGIVLEGAMKLVMNGESHLFQRGDTHFIPANVEHEATLYAGWKGLYVFPHDSRPVPTKTGSN